MGNNLTAVMLAAVLFCGVQIMPNPMSGITSVFGAEPLRLNAQETDLATFGHPDAISVSPDGSTFAIVEQRDVRSRVDAIGLNMNRSGVHPNVHLEGVTASTNAIAFPMFSPKINKWVWCVVRKRQDRRQYLSEHDELSVGGGSFASNGRFGYAAKDDGTWKIVVDRKVFRFARCKEIIAPITFSSDGAHWACPVSLLNGEQALVLDGVRQGLKCAWINRVTFSPDGKHVAYIAELENPGQFYVVDGVPNTSFDGIYSIAGGHTLFSEDSASYAYTAKRGDQKVVIVNGEVYEEDASFPILSADGKSVITSRTVQDGGQQGMCISINRQHGNTYKEIKNVNLSPNNRKVTYYAVDSDEKQYFIVEDMATREVIKYGPYGKGVDVPVFDATGDNVWYAAQLQDKWHLFRNGAMVTKKGYDGFANLEGIPTLRRSQDGRHVAVIGVSGETVQVVVNGWEGPTHSLKPEYFSITPGHFEQTETGLVYKYFVGLPWSWGFTVRLMSINVPAS